MTYRTDEMDLTWVESSGGPLVLLPLDNLGAWEGCDRPAAAREVEARARWGDPASPATDYDRACDVEDWIALIDVGGADALVLGNEPLTTAWVGDGSGGGVLVRWGAGRDPNSVLSRLDDLLANGETGEGLEFRVGSTPLLLFDAAFRGDDPDALAYGAVVPLAPGTYRVVVFEHTVPGSDPWVVLHRFRPDAGGV